MKKVLIFVLVILCACAAFQLYNVNLVKNFSQNLKNIESQDFKLLDTNTSSSLFSSKSENVIRLYNIDFKVISETSHVLGFVRSRGQVQVLSEPFATLARIAFSDKNITFEQNGDVLSLEIPPFNFENEGKKYNANKSQITLKNDFTKGLKFGEIGIKNDYLSVESFSQNASLKGLNLDFKSSEQKDKIALDMNIASFDSGFMGLFGFSGDGVLLSLDSDNGDGKLGAKITKLKLGNDEIQNILLDLNFLNLNQNALFSENFYDILKTNSKIELTNAQFSANNGVFKANLALNINEEYDQNLENIMNFSTLNGAMSASKALTKMLPSLAMMISPVEFLAQGAGILVKENEGYKTSFKSIKNDIIFNEKISLQQILSNELLKLFR